MKGSVLVVAGPDHRGEERDGQEGERGGEDVDHAGDDVARAIADPQDLANCR
jgi:hypothetical protein